MMTTSYHGISFNITYHFWLHFQEKLLQEVVASAFKDKTVLTIAVSKMNYTTIIIIERKHLRTALDISHPC